MIRMVTVQTQFIVQNCIEPEGTFSQTGSHIYICYCNLLLLPQKKLHSVTLLSQDTRVKGYTNRTSWESVEITHGLESRTL